MKMKHNERPIDVFRIAIFSFFGALLFLTTSVTVQAQAKPAKPRVQTARVLITEHGFTPYNIRLRRGVPVRLVFQRKTDETCVTEFVIGDYGIRRSLPLNQSVTINFTPKRPGEIGFACGMNMHRGKLIVQ